MAGHTNESVASRGRTQEQVAIAFLVLSWIFITLRIWTRTYVLASFGWDDTTMIFAAILFTVYCAIIIVCAAQGGGTHVTSITGMIRLIKWTITSEVAYITTVMLLKISLAIFFTRIVVKRSHRHAIYLTLAISIISSIMTFFYVLFRCGTDLNMYLFRQLASQCTSRTFDRFMAYQQASITTLTDCVFLVLPFMILWNGQMTVLKKLSVGFILSLAALGVLCSMVRFKYVDGLTQIDDFYWNSTNIAIWSTIEPGAGIIAGCLATLRPLFKNCFATAKSIRSSTRRSNNANPSSGSQSLRDAQDNTGKLLSGSTLRDTVRSIDSKSFTLRDDIEMNSNAFYKSESHDFILSPTTVTNSKFLQRDQGYDTDRRSILDIAQLARFPLPPQSTISGGLEKDIK